MKSVAVKRTEIFHSFWVWDERKKRINWIIQKVQIWCLTKLSEMWWKWHLECDSCWECGVSSVQRFDRQEYYSYPLFVPRAVDCIM